MTLVVPAGSGPARDRVRFEDGSDGPGREAQEAPQEAPPRQDRQAGEGGQADTQAHSEADAQADPQADPEAHAGSHPEADAVAHPGTPADDAAHAPAHADVGPHPDPASTPSQTPAPGERYAVPATPAMGATLTPSARERLFLNRFGTGFSQHALAGLRAVGTPEQWLAAQLQPTLFAEHPKVAEVDGWFQPLWRSPAAKWATQVGGTKSGWEYGLDLGNWSLLRRIYSERSLLETMTDFWATNLNIPVGHDRAWIHRFDYDATIRANALGTFEDLLRECALHPAMRLYLDNWKSVRGIPNENQGRELLEIHTVGRDAGYTEAMVKDSAVLLSGYTVDWGESFEGYYKTAAHTTGAVKVLGFTHANASTDGQAATVAYLRYLAHHPSTARNLARKLATYFVSDSPSAGLVEAIASAYLAAGTSIGAALTALAAHPEFAGSAGAKVRTPSADLVATARVLEVDVNADPTGDHYARNAQWSQGGPQLFTWPRPDGPPVTGEAWSSASRMFSSFEMHWGHAGGWWPKGAAYTPPASWLPATSLRLDAYVDHLCRRWLGRAADQRLVDAVAQGTGVAAGATVTADHAVARWLHPRLAVALLDTPDHMTT